jgi:hypothetical protein
LLSHRLLTRLTVVPPTAEERADPYKERPWIEGIRSRYPYGTSVPTSAWLGLYGIAVTGDESLVILVDESFSPPAPTDLYRSPASDLLKELIDVPLPKSTLILGIAPPIPQYRRSFVCNGRAGTLGAEVVTPASNAGVLTAGHAAAPVGAAVIDAISDESLGIVTFTEDPMTAPATMLCADVAVIETNSTYEPLEVKPKGPERALPGYPVTMYGSSGTESSGIFAYSPWLHVPMMAGMWANIYMTHNAISQHGDSGAMVLLQGEDRIIGHVVGASPGMMTYVQDIEYQLATSHTKLSV